MAISFSNSYNKVYTVSYLVTFWFVWMQWILVLDRRILKTSFSIFTWLLIMFFSYRMSYNVRTKYGLLSGLLAAFVCCTNAILHLFCYSAIKSRVLNQQNWLLFHKQKNLQNSNNSNDHDHQKQAYWTSLKCLTTHMQIATYTYCPLAILLSAEIYIQFMHGVTSTVLSGLMVVLGNSSGWVNAFGYFYNDHLKTLRSKRNLQI